MGILPLEIKSIIIRKNIEDRLKIVKKPPNKTSNYKDNFNKNKFKKNFTKSFLHELIDDLDVNDKSDMHNI